METNDIGSIMLLGPEDIDQEITGLHYLLSISWVSDDGTNKDIAADDDFLLEDSNGFRIASKRAEAAGDDFGKPFSAPLPVNGIVLKKLDGGICYIYLKTM